MGRMLATRLYLSPLGPLRLEAVPHGARRIAFLEAANDPPKTGKRAPGHPDSERILDQLQAELDAYFAGSKRAFATPLALQGTSFQRAIWEALRAIPYGERSTYGQLARAIGRPGAARAAGGANNRNPLPIVVPCHRALGAGGALVGYAGGLWRKAWLLDRERAASRAA